MSNPTDPRDGQPSLAIPPSPEPWYVEEDGGRFEIVAADGYSVAMIRSPYRSGNEARANAHLLAASPRMLKALRTVLAERESGGRLNCWDEVEAAIKEGEGR